MAPYRSTDEKIRIASESLAARWLGRRSYRFGRPIAGVLQRSKPRSLFVENELLVDSADQDTLRQLVEQHDAEVIPFPPVPDQPAGMDPERRRSVEDMPLPVTVRLRAENLPLDGLDEAAGGEPDGQLIVTSRAGAGLLALTRRLLRDGRRVMPNLIGGPTALPLTTASEGTSPDPFTLPEYNGPTRIVQAWQLVQAYAAVRSLHMPVFLAIFDAGFALDANGRPLWINGQAPDVTQYIQWNIFYELLPDFLRPTYEMLGESRSAGGQNDEAGKEYHGNQVLSAAAAPIGNSAGAAGSGGLSTLSGNQIVTPVLFKMFRSAQETIRGLQLSLAWGVDVINMSWEIAYDSALFYNLDASFPTGQWESAFRYAADQGVVMFAAAGNETAELPDKVALPATRTPGVITVGALSTGTNLSWPGSNYGSSVDIWAPGTGITVMPDPKNTGGSQQNGTSLASPLTAGVAALMLAINSSLHGSDIKRILRETGYHDLPDGKVTAALNAQAAILNVMGGRLPDSYEEPNNNASAARRLNTISPGLLAAQEPALLSDRNDEDWYFFDVVDYYSLDASFDFVPQLSWAGMLLVPEDPDSRAGSDEVDSYSPGHKHMFINQIAPGRYRLKVNAGGPNMYTLSIRLTPNPLTPDMFENNDSQPAAARFSMKPPPPLSDFPLGIDLFPTFSPGFYEANLHVSTDVDYYRIQDISTLALVKTIFAITDSDAPIDVALLGPDGMELEPPQRVRHTELRLPGPECWVRISSPTANRYRFRLYDALDDSMAPGPWQEVDLNPIPLWLPDPAEGLAEYERYYHVEIDDELLEIGKLRLTGDPGLTLHLIDESGQAILAAQPARVGETDALELDLSAVRPGTYVARVGREISPADRLAPGLSQKLARFQLGPGW